MPSANFDLGLVVAARGRKERLRKVFQKGSSGAIGLRCSRPSCSHFQRLRAQAQGTLRFGSCESHLAYRQTAWLAISTIALGYAGSSIYWCFIVRGCMLHWDSLMPDSGPHCDTYSLFYGLLMNASYTLPFHIAAVSKLLALYCTAESTSFSKQMVVFRLMRAMVLGHEGGIMQLHFPTAQRNLRVAFQCKSRLV